MWKSDKQIQNELKEERKTLYSKEEVIQLLIDCCGEISCEDGSLLGKYPADLYKWIENNINK